MELYAQLAPAVYMATLLALTAWGARELALHPGATKLLRRPRHARIWGVYLGCLAGAVLAGGIAVLGGYRTAVAGAFVFAAVVGLLVCAAIASGVARLEEGHAAEPLSRSRFAVVALAMLAWSAGAMPLVLWVLGLIRGEPVEMRVVEGGVSDVYTQAPPMAYLALALLGLAAAVQEEIVFRGAVQAGLARTRLGSTGAVVVASALWAIAHGGSYVEPAGLKEVQIFGLGIIFGIMRERHGLGAAVALHLINNGVVLALEPLLGS